MIYVKLKNESKQLRNVGDINKCKQVGQKEAVDLCGDECADRHFSVDKLRHQHQHLRVLVNQLRILRALFYVAADECHDACQHEIR
jgi:hypothetical protein